MFIYPIIIGLLGAMLYAFRGGWFNDLPNTINRAVFITPYCLLTLWLIGGNPINLTAFTVTTYGAIALGHGLFMTMGRWRPAGYHQYVKRYNSRPLLGTFTEEEKPISWILGKKDYAWDNDRQFVYDFAGMAMVGVIRHCPIWFLYNGANATQCLADTLLGVLHPLAYEIGHRIPPCIFLKINSSNLNRYGEFGVGIIFFAGKDLIWF